VTATINWYRAAFQTLVGETVDGILSGKNTKNEPTPTLIRVPTLILWGEEDKALSKWLAEDSAAHCSLARIRYFPGAGHQLMQEQPQEVTQAVLEFLGGVSPSREPQPNPLPISKS